jgi:hypothetical protein
MKQTIVLISILLITFFGCSEKSGFLNSDTQRESSLMHTKKGEIYNSMEIKATIVATHLNNVVKKYNNSKNEVFLIALFIDEDLQQKDKSGINNPDILLTLNGKKASNVILLKHKDALVSYAPLLNSWSKYYLVEFDKSDSMKMELRSKKYGKVVLEF